MKWLVAVLLLLGHSAPAWAQPVAQPDMTIDATRRDEVIDRALALLNEFYVFPDLAKKMETAVRESQKQGAYAALTSALAFRQRLEDDLRAVSHDKHLTVDYSAAPQPVSQPGDSQREHEESRAFLARQNFCFERAARLPGNVGYVDIRCFGPADLIAETVAATFSFLGHTKALIVDLRENRGGDPAGVALVSSYLFGTPTHLNDVYTPREKRTDQYWTLPYVPGRRVADVDVYVLTSSHTFSAGEELAYDLQALRRATIVGEVSGGGAHPVSPHRIDDHFSIGVPFARAINPITGTNWEGVGVNPDEKAPANQALTVAHLRALQKLRPKEQNLLNLRYLDEAIAATERELAGLRK